MIYIIMTSCHGLVSEYLLVTQIGEKELLSECFSPFIQQIVPDHVLLTMPQHSLQLSVVFGSHLILTQLLDLASLPEPFVPYPSF